MLNFLDKNLYDEEGEFEESTINFLGQSTNYK